MREVTAIFCSYDPVLGFELLAICVGQLADEVPLISPLRPGFGECAPTEREERRIWSVSEKLSSRGKDLVISKISWANPRAFRYTIRSR